MIDNGKKVDILVVGGGAAGMAAALAAAERGKHVLLTDRNPYLGGVLPQCIHHGFGNGYFGEDITGPEYARRFVEQIQRSPVEVMTDTMVIRLQADKTALLSGAGGLMTVAFDHCILATGCRERPLGALPTGGTRPAGIFTAGQAQKLVNLGGYDVGERIVILGSGDIGQIMARRFSLLGKTVVAMIEIRDTLGGMARNQKECIRAFNIPVILSATVDEVLGTGRMEGVMVRHLPDGRRERLDCDTLVTALGLIPERDLVRHLEQNGTFPSWLSLCGNCEHVHEIVDSVTVQAQRLGASV